LNGRSQCIRKKIKSTRLCYTNAGIAIVGAQTSLSLIAARLSFLDGNPGFMEADNICVHRNELITELKCV
jgi:hypothetical protein